VEQTPFIVAIIIAITGCLVLFTRLAEAKVALEQLQTKLDSTQSELQRVTSDLTDTSHKLSDAQRELERLKLELASATAALTDANQRMERYAAIRDIENEIERLQAEGSRIQGQIAVSVDQRDHLKEEVERLSREVAAFGEVLEVYEFGLYEPKYDFGSSEAYKQRLDEVRAEQKRCIKAGLAATCSTKWTVGNSERDGEKMVKEQLQLMLLAFNGECDSLIAVVKYNNAAKIEERIEKSWQQINNKGKTKHCQISPDYKRLKLEEMRLVHEYAAKKQEEAEEQRAIREQMKEEERAQRELERAQMEAEREALRYAKALQKATEEVGKAEGERRRLLEEQIAELNTLLAQANDKRERALSMAQQTKVGYVYVISNIGAMGEQVYKVGMTRRLDPMDRVKELGDASVPFPFDVHAMIFSEDAPALEAKLHRVFEKHRVNRVNYRKEFFRIPLEKIRDEVVQRGAEIEFTMIAEAAEYRQTQSILEEERQALVGV